MYVVSCAQMTLYQPTDWAARDISVMITDYGCPILFKE